MNSVLKIRDANGNFIPINAIRGENGKSAYEQAKEGGYTGTEQEFIALLNGLTSTLDANHYSDFNNPHKVTAEHVGAIPSEWYVSSNLDEELTLEEDKTTIVAYDENTLSVPISDSSGEPCRNGYVITFSRSSGAGTQLCVDYAAGDVYIRGLYTEWVRLINRYDYAELDSAISSYEVDLIDVKDNVEMLAKRVTPIDLGGTGATTPEEALANLGSKRIVTGSYTGTGTYGSNNKNIIPCDFKPSFMIIKSRDSTGGHGIWGGYNMEVVFDADNRYAYNAGLTACGASYSEGMISWYSATSAKHQLNVSGQKYTYLLIE